MKICGYGAGGEGDAVGVPLSAAKPAELGVQEW